MRIAVTIAGCLAALGCAVPPPEPAAQERGAQVHAQHARGPAIGLEIMRIKIIALYNTSNRIAANCSGDLPILVRKAIHRGSS